MFVIPVSTERRLFRRLRQLAVTCVVASTATAWGQAQAPASKDTLPKDFRPPRAVLDVINAEDELTTEDAYSQWKKKELTNFGVAIKSPRLNPAQTKQIEDGCKLRVQRLSLKVHRNNLKPVRVEIYRTLHLEATPAARDVAFKAIAAEAERLLAGNLTVRLQALILLSELETVAANPAKNAPAVLYADALNIYFKVINDSKQPEAVRLLTASLTEKLLKESGLATNPPAKLRIEAGKVLAPLVAKNDSNEWYQKALVTALQAVNLPTIPDASNVQQPIIANTLHKVIADPMRTYMVRSKAVQAFGNLSLPQSGVDFAAVTKDMLKLTREISTDYNAGKVNATKATFQLQDIYLGLKAWKAASPNDKNVQAAYTAALPPVRHALKNLQNNPPAAMPKDTLDGINAIIGVEKKTAEQPNVNAKQG